MDYDKAWLLLMRVRWFSLGMTWLSSFGLSSTFMFGIWHGGEWMNMDLTHTFYGQVERCSPITGWFIALINDKLIPLVFICKFISVYMDFDG